MIFLSLKYIKFPKFSNLEKGLFWDGLIIPSSIELGKSHFFLDDVRRVLGISGNIKGM